MASVHPKPKSDKIIPLLLVWFFFIVAVEFCSFRIPIPNTLFVSSFTATRSFIPPRYTKSASTGPHHVISTNKEDDISFLNDILHHERSHPDSGSENHQIFIGKNKWLGGAIDPSDGTIYGIPSNADSIICLRPTRKAAEAANTTSYHEDVAFGSDANYEIHTIPLPNKIQKGKFKWLRGIICKGYLYGIPAWSNDGVLRLDLQEMWKNYERKEEHDIITEDRVVSIIPLPEEFLTQKSEDRPTRWLWHGAALNSNQTAIYCIPSNAHQVLKVDLNEPRCAFLAIPAESNTSKPSTRATKDVAVASATPLSQTNKWYGGILGNDNCIYGVPYSASNVLRIDANTDEVTLLGDYGLNKYNWHGGVKSYRNGCIYCFPAHHSEVLKIDTSQSCGAGERLSLVPIRRPPYDSDKVTRYKWLGGSVGADGNVYGMPSDASSILRIDTENDIATTFGIVSGEKNKWQGGVLSRDGIIYAIPSNAKQILCIDTAVPSKESDKSASGDEMKYSFVGNFSPKKDKWQGGLLGLDGSIYCIPENANKVLKVIPQKEIVDTEIDYL